MLCSPYRWDSAQCDGWCRPHQSHKVRLRSESFYRWGLACLECRWGPCPPLYNLTHSDSRLQGHPHRFLWQRCCIMVLYPFLDYLLIGNLLYIYTSALQLSPDFMWSKCNKFHFKYLQFGNIVHWTNLNQKKKKYILNNWLQIWSMCVRLRWKFPFRQFVRTQKQSWCTIFNVLFRFEFPY